ncbi:MAG: orotidine 5'-phosphate decarboxylase, partial [Pseudomonadota bacterium]|nr:orotidine 5'-phosphate decarboxylase [Pseudomonadota bacterium]
VHTGLDAQAAGQTPFADLSLVASLNLGVRISVAGGINKDTIQKTIQAGATIVVVGAAIYGAESPAASAKELRALVDAA